jgi:hypothetical protein
LRHSAEFHRPPIHQPTPFHEAIRGRLETQTEALENNACERMKTKAAFSNGTRKTNPKTGTQGWKRSFYADVHEDFWKVGQAFSLLLLT